MCSPNIEFSVTTKATDQNPTSTADPRPGGGGPDGEVKLEPYPLRIEVHPLLVYGCMGSGPGSVFIFLDKDLDREEAKVTLWHEIIHVLLTVGKQPHDEEEIDAMAKKLADACPEILKMCGVDAAFK